MTVPPRQNPSSHNQFFEPQVLIFDPFFSKSLCKVKKFEHTTNNGSRAIVGERPYRKVTVAGGDSRVNPIRCAARVMVFAPTFIR